MRTNWTSARSTPPLLPSLLALAAAGLLPAGVSGQALSQPKDGPVIEGYGAVYAVPGSDYATPRDHAYRVVFDVAEAPESPEAVNPRINTLARFLNMHAQDGVAPDKMELALVLHGSAGKDALDHAGYRKRFGVDNPNRELIQRLEDAGVDIYLCGQTAQHRGLPREELAPAVQLALSAMTVLVTLQAQGFQLIAF